MDREAWHAAIHGVAKSRTWLNDWTELNWIILNKNLSQNLHNFFNFFKVFYLKSISVTKNCKLILKIALYNNKLEDSSAYRSKTTFWGIYKTLSYFNVSSAFSQILKCECKCKQVNMFLWWSNSFFNICDTILKIFRYTNISFHFLILTMYLLLF